MSTNSVTIDRKIKASPAKKRALPSNQSPITDHQSHSTGRGRPREFDEAEALDCALELFWRQGYEGTSIADLRTAIGITAPSLYAAFGSKEELYRRVLERYLTGLGRCLVDALREERTTYCRPGTVSVRVGEEFFQC